MSAVLKKGEYTQLEPSIQQADRKACASCGVTIAGLVTAVAGAVLYPAICGCGYLYSQMLGPCDYIQNNTVIVQHRCTKHLDAVEDWYEECWNTGWKVALAVFGGGIALTALGYVCLRKNVQYVNKLKSLPGDERTFLF